jgi:hypothetical protein
MTTAFRQTLQRFQLATREAERLRRILHARFGFNDAQIGAMTPQGPIANRLGSERLVDIGLANETLRNRAPRAANYLTSHRKGSIF